MRLGSEWAERKPVALARVYSPKGRLAHLMNIDLPLSGGHALCNRLSDHWLGTRSERDERKAARLPLCPQCEEYARVKEWS